MQGNERGLVAKIRKKESSWFGWGDQLGRENDG